MRSTFEAIAVTGFILLLAYLLVSPIVGAVAASMDNSANMIAEATHGR